MSQIKVHDTGSCDKALGRKPLRGMDVPGHWKLLVSVMPSAGEGMAQLPSPSAPSAPEVLNGTPVPQTLLSSHFPSCSSRHGILVQGAILFFRC